MSSRLFDDASSQDLVNTSWTAVTAPPFTMFCRSRSDTTAANQSVMTISDVDGDVNFWTMYRSNAVRLNMFVQDSGGSDITTGGTVIATGTWESCCMVVAAANDRTIYLDDNAGVNDTTSISPSGIENFSIGSLNRASPAQYMSGEIADALVVNLAATAAEVTDLHNGTISRRFRPKNIKGYWRLFGDDSPETDKSFDKTGLTLQNAPTKSSATPPQSLHTDRVFDRSHRNRSRGMRRQIAKGTSTGGFDP